jgi:23S rRNA-/tRNA-specific pseudouridylate synthase
LIENDALRVYSTDDPKRGKFSRTHYQVVKTGVDRALLKIRLITGRKNQIRVHLADKGWPIVGDSKYGYANRNSKRMALHSHTISFAHPYNGELMSFTAPIPQIFHRMPSAAKSDGSGKRGKRR